MHKHGMSPSLLHGLSILTGASLMLVAAPASADVELAPLVVIDFSAFDGSGFDPEPAAGQLDSDDWSIVLGPADILDFGGSQMPPGSDFARGLGTGGTDVDGIWAFDVDGAGLIALGVAPNEDIFTPGMMILRLANNTGGDVAEFQVEYTVWVNNDQDGASTFDLMQSPDNDPDGAGYTLVGDSFESTAAADAMGFVATDFVEVVTPAAPIGDTSQYYIAWAGADVGMPTDRDEFGVEGITIRLLNVCGNGLMEDDEACDDGLDNADTAACTSTCAVAACGDGLVQDGVEECDDGNTDDGDGCAADCTEEAATTDTDTDTDSGGSGSDTDGDTDPGTGTSASATDASATSPTTTSPTTTAGSDSDTDGDDGGADDDESGCACRSSGGDTPVWGMLGMLVLGLVRRRR
jgi:MYXO-CTERM domain-containing protein